MIDTDAVGQQKLQELLRELDSVDWSDWELDFLTGIRTKTYAQLTSKQKSAVGRLWDQLQRA